MRHFLVALFICCVAVPARMSAQTAGDYVSRAKAFCDKGEYDEAIAACNQALAAADPNDPHFKHNISGAYNNRGTAWDEKGEHDKAIADYNQALAINPKDASAYLNRGAAWHDKGEHDKAIADFTKALAIEANYAPAYYNRGYAWDEKGEYDKAIADYKKALAINPNCDAAYNNLAWIYATCPDATFRDGKKAVGNANKAYQLSGAKHWYILHTLAAAYAESGDFTKGLEFEAKAIELAPEKSKQALRSRLELYKQEKPYHEQPVKK